MNPPPKPPTSLTVPTPWSGEQALAVLEGLQVLREAVWSVYGPQAQQAWREQLVPDYGPPELYPELPF